MERIKENLFNALYLQSEFWVTTRQLNIFIPWKIHIYIDNEDDFLKISDFLIPYLINQNVNHKFVPPKNISTLNKSNQKGKAIVIYPLSIEFARLIMLQLDTLFNAKDLSISNSHIQGDKQYGSSGRIFYRYELDSGKYKNVQLDLTKTEMLEFYNQHYEPNRGGNNYLASDMKIKDDPFLT